MRFNPSFRDLDTSESPNNENDIFPKQIAQVLSPFPQTEIRKPSVVFVDIE